MKKTFIVNISDIDKAWSRIEKRTKYEINKCELNVWKTKNIHWFNDLHKVTRPDRYIDDDFIPYLYSRHENEMTIYRTDTAGAVIYKHRDTTYYLFGARDKRLRPDGSSSKILWEAMKDANKEGIKYFDLCGANKPQIAFFKRGFGGKLVEHPCDYFEMLNL